MTRAGRIVFTLFVGILGSVMAIFLWPQYERGQLLTGPVASVAGRVQDALVKSGSKGRRHLAVTYTYTTEQGPFACTETVASGRTTPANEYQARADEYLRARDLKVIYSTLDHSVSTINPTRAKADARSALIGMLVCGGIMCIMVICAWAAPLKSATLGP